MSEISPGAEDLRVAGGDLLDEGGADRGHTDDEDRQFRGVSPRRKPPKMSAGLCAMRRSMSCSNSAASKRSPASARLSRNSRFASAKPREGLVEAVGIVHDLAEGEAGDDAFRRGRARRGERGGETPHLVGTGHAGGR